MIIRVLFILLVALVVGNTMAVRHGAAQEVTVPMPEFGTYHALVVGNNDYVHLPKLETAVGDALAVATLLEEKYGFDVTMLRNATREQIANAFNALR